MNGEFVEIGNTFIEIPLGIGAFAISSLLGVLVYLNNPKSWTNRLFLLLAIIINVYIVVNFLSIHPPIKTAENHLFWIRFVMFVTSFMGLMLFLFVHTFPHATISLAKKYLFALGLLTLSSAAASLTPLVFSSIHYPGGTPTPVPGPGIALFFLNFVGLFFLSFVVLIYKYLKTQGVERIQHLHLLLGVILSFSGMAIFTVIFVVILKIPFFVFLGPVLPVILMLFISYSIIKYQFLGIKVLATEVLTTILAIITLSEALVSNSINVFLFRIFVFAAVLGFGVLLIRSVRKEVQQREQLEKLSQDLAEANQELKRLDKAKSEFVSIASHQLRTPLTAMKGYLSLLLDGSYGQIGQAFKKPIHSVYDSNQRLIHLVNDLLSLSRIESGKIKLEPEPTNIQEVIQSVIDELKLKAEQKNLELVFKEPAPPLPAAMLDPEKIRNVILNLIDNSIRYTRQGSITTGIQQAGKVVHITIADTGEGMNKEELQKLFQSFSRGQAGKELSTEGAGLGLYIARQFVEMHKGKIWAKSEGKGKGSAFHIELPVR